MLIDLEGKSGSSSIINPIVGSIKKEVVFNKNNRYKIVKQKTKTNTKTYIYK